MAGRVLGFTAVYALVDANFELAGGPKRTFHHVIATSTAGAWVHAATRRTTVGIIRAIGIGAGLGVLTAPLYYLMFESSWLDPKPKSMLEIVRDVGALVRGPQQTDTPDSVPPAVPGKDVSR